MYAGRMGKKIEGCTPEVFSRFYAYHWPGNIRELENVIERMVVLAQGPVLDRDLLPPELRSSQVTARTLVEEGSTRVIQVREEAERECIITALEANGWNRTQAARELGIDKATLWRKMKRYTITQ